MKKASKISNLTLDPTHESKDILSKYKEMRSKIRDVTRSVANNSDNYDKKYLMRNSDDDLPLNKPLKVGNITVVVRPVFHESNKYCLTVFLDKSFYKLG